MKLYTPLEEAAEIIKSRWLDDDLRKAVEDGLRGDVPEVLKEGPSGMLFRQIGTPDGEFARFLEHTHAAGVRPVCTAYAEDEFCSNSFTKWGLAKLVLATGVNKLDQNMVIKRRIIDFADAEGKRLCDVRTLWGEGLVEFHHSFLQTMYPVMQGKVIDASQWYRRHGPAPRRYYLALMSLAICHTIWFDDYDLLDSEMGFTNEIVLPAFEEAQARFGVKPLIVRISDPGEHQRDPFWWCYSRAAKEFVDEHVKQFLARQNATEGRE